MFWPKGGNMFGKGGTTDRAETTMRDEKEFPTTSPEAWEKYKREHPEQFAFTPEWRARVQAEATNRMLMESGLIH